MRIDGGDIQEAKDDALDLMRSHGDNVLYLDEVEQVLDAFIKGLTERAQ